MRQRALMADLDAQRRWVAGWRLIVEAITHFNESADEALLVLPALEP